MNDQTSLGLDSGAYAGIESAHELVLATETNEKVCTQTLPVKNTTTETLLSPVSQKCTTVKLIQSEDRSTGTVSPIVYKQYFDFASSGKHGILVMLLILFLFIAAQFARTGADVWLSWWSNLQYFPTESTGFWLGIYFAWNMATLILSLIRSFCFADVSIRASSALHDTTFQHLLRAPVPTFFDVTP
jgi:hypothetical protein